MGSSYDESSDSECEDSGDEMVDDEPVGGRRIEDFYVIGKQIGKGAFSVVREGLNKATGQKVGIKSIRTKFIKTKLLMREIEIMKKVGNHPNILKLYEVFETKQHLYLVLELVTGGELFDQIVARGEYSEKDASNIVRQIISAVAHLHANGIAHRDLKPQNLLCAGAEGDGILFNNNRGLKCLIPLLLHSRKIVEGCLAHFIACKCQSTLCDIRVADFGLSKIFSDGENLETCCGSPEYVAPEVLECKPYDKACDLWSVGVITYVLLTGCFPFWDKNNAVLYEKIRRVEYGWPSGLEISAEAKDLIKHLIERQPEKRFTAEQALRHPWVSGQGVSSTKRLSSAVNVTSRRPGK